MPHEENVNKQKALFFFHSEFFSKIKFSKMYLQTVLVTGASRGLGLEFVKQLASTPYCQKIIASCRKPDESEMLKELTKNEKVVVKKLDVDDIQSFEEFVEDLKVTLFLEITYIYSCLY